jgi:hypothetical protein
MSGNNSNLSTIDRQ